MNQHQKKELIAQIRSGEKANISKAIEVLRHEGDTETLTALLDALYDSENQEISDEIFAFLYDLKSPEALHVLVDFIQNDFDSIWKTELITSIWQAGLDAAEYLSVFVDIVIEDEFLTAFEAVTVIENIQTQVPLDILDDNIKKIEASLHVITQDKRTLAESLIFTLKNFKLGEFTRFYSEN